MESKLPLVNFFVKLKNNRQTAKYYMLFSLFFQVKYVEAGFIGASENNILLNFGLLQREMGFNDENLAISYLTRISYFRLK